MKVGFDIYGNIKNMKVVGFYENGGFLKNNFVVLKVYLYPLLLLYFCHLQIHILINFGMMSSVKFIKKFQIKIYMIKNILLLKTRAIF